LPPDERRAALIAATLPLLRTHGDRVTTRAIAAASGVAEGTIFRVFADKDELIQATLATALDPAPTLAEIDAIDLGPPLEARLIEVASILQRRLLEVFSLLMVMGIHGPPPEPDDRSTMTERLTAAVERVVGPDADQLRRSPKEVARLLRLFVFSGSHPLITDGQLVPPTEIVSIVLDGVRRPTSHPDPFDHPGSD
jgi:AcrR family transcriptional regulator